MIKTDEPMEAVAQGASMSAFIKTNMAEKNHVVDIQEEVEENEQEIDTNYNRPKLAESIFIDIENMLPLKIIDSEISIPCKGVVDHKFKVSSSGVCFNSYLFPVHSPPPLPLPKHYLLL